MNTQHADTSKDHLLLKPKEKLTPVQFEQIQQEARQQTLDNLAVNHTSKFFDNIQIKEDQLLLLCPTAPPEEIQQFQKVPFIVQPVNNNIKHENESHAQEIQSQALVTANALNSHAYHPFSGATQSQFIITLDPLISQILQSSILQQLHIGFNGMNIDNNYIGPVI